MRKDANKIIEARRKELGLSDMRLAHEMGISIDSYCDIEWHGDEIYSVVQLQRIKKMCDVLRLALFDVLGMECAFCGEKRDYSNDYQLPRHQLVKARRQKLGLTQAQLGDKANFQDYAIEGMERNPDYLELSTIESILELASQIDVPPQVLFRLKCLKCNR